MPKIYLKEELDNLKSTEKDGVINADKTFVVIAGNTYLLADLLSVNTVIDEDVVVDVPKKITKKK